MIQNVNKKLKASNSVCIINTFNNFTTVKNRNGVEDRTANIFSHSLDILLAISPIFQQWTKARRYLL